MKAKPIPQKPKRMTKEEFLIQWVLARASFRSEFSGIAAVKAADEVWKEIQRLK
jgi:hypothetical protein